MERRAQQVFREDLCRVRLEIIASLDDSTNRESVEASRDSLVDNMPLSMVGNWLRNGHSITIHSGRTVAVTYNIP